MDWKVFGTAFVSLFLAEMGDKTQLATMAMAAGTRRPWAVFAGGAAALVVVTALGAAAGGWVTRYVPEIWIRRVAGVSFVAIGLVMLIRKEG